MAQEIPVYLFTGLMDSGKTSLIKETLFENDFGDGEPGIVILCEDGECEFDETELAEKQLRLVRLEEESNFTTETLKQINDTYHPQIVFIEYNGTWGIDKIVDAVLPEGWVIVQALTTVDSTTFDLYLNNMRVMVQDQLFESDVIIFNRTDDETDRGHLRRSAKTINRKAQIVYERKDGTIDERPEELPFDIDADIIELSDADYAIWYMDCMEHYKKYDGKKVHFTGLVYNPDTLKHGVFVPGRFAMTCCVDDIQFFGFKCKYDRESELEHRSWIDFTGEIHVEFAKEYKGKGPVLYPIDIKPAEKPEDELVYVS